MSEEEIIDRLMMIDQWKVSGDIYTQDELNAIGELLDLYNKEKENNKELKKANKKLQTDIEIKDKVIEEIKSKLQKHINFCEQESRGHLENKVCHISLKFEKNLLEEVEKVGEKDE